MNLSRPLPSMDAGDTLDTVATVGDSQANGAFAFSSDKWGCSIRFETLRND